MKGCKRESVLVSDKGLCFDNISAAVESFVDSHLLLVFVAVLLVMGVCSAIATGQPTSTNTDNKLQQINNSIDRRNN